LCTDIIAVNTNAEQKARLLEVKVIENQQTIDQLREERLILTANHKDLEKRFAQASEVSMNNTNRMGVLLKAPSDREQTS
jgi:hypothetical protein